MRETLVPLLLAFFAPILATQEADELYHELERLGWDLTDETKVPGVSIAVIRGGEVAWYLGCGFADLESETEVTPQTIFNIGSISKTVAAWGLLSLVEDGKLALDVPVDRYLTRWRLPESEFDAAGVTLERLLSHTAGLSLHGYPGFDPGQALPTIEASLGGDTNGSEDVRLIHAPGSKWKYSGGGYTIAQLLVEEVTGERFAEFMRDAVFGPLGMEHSDYRWTEEIDRLAATPYDRNGEPIGGPRFTAQAAASLQTSAEELARFAIAGMTKFSENPVLDPETIERMQVPMPPGPEAYGLGYMVQEHEGFRTVGHGGSNRGWIARLTIAPETGDAIVILTNGSNGGRVTRPIEEAWLGSLADRVAAASGE